MAEKRHYRAITFWRGTEIVRLLGPYRDGKAAVDELNRIEIDDDKFDRIDIIRFGGDPEGVEKMVAEIEEADKEWRAQIKKDWKAEDDRIRTLIEKERANDREVRAAGCSKGSATRRYPRARR